MFQRLALAAAASIIIGTIPVSADTDVISISETQVMRLGVRNTAVTPAERQALVVVPGRVTAPFDARLTIAAPFAGTVLSVEKLEGSGVRAGDSLLTVASNDYLAAQAQYAQSKADYEALNASAERLRVLADEGVVAESRAEAANAAAAVAKADMDSTSRLLAQVQPVVGQNGAYILLAPGDGTIAQLDVQPGDMIDTLDGAVVLEDAGTLWLEAELPARLLGQTKAGETVRLEPYGVEGKIIAVGRTVDSQSRSVTIRAALEGNSSLKPGQIGQATIFGAVQSGALAVPRDALVRLSGNDVVFVAVAGGYRPVSVTVLSRGADDAIIVGPVARGAEVAVSGLTELKAIALGGM